MKKASEMRQLFEKCEKGYQQIMKHLEAEAEKRSQIGIRNYSYTAASVEVAQRVREDLLLLGYKVKAGTNLIVEFSW